MSRISVVTPCFNEQGNVTELYNRVTAIFDARPEDELELIYIDNASTDATVPEVKDIIARDSRVRLIVNARNFGHIRSPYHGMLQASGDCVIVMVSDLQDPPELIPTFLEHWREGYKVVLGVKTNTQETPSMAAVRSAYYWLINRISEVELPVNATGFGLYDRVVLDTLRTIPDPYPYFRGLIAELGWTAAKVPFTQPLRRRGITKNNFYTLYDLAMLGITNHSKVPLRIVTFFSFVVAVFSFLVAMGYLIAKLIMWDRFPNVGQAPTVVGLFFFGSVQLLFTGLLGEYVLAIHTQVLRRPHVVERERVNFPTSSAVGKPF